MRLLVVEDDREAADYLKKALREAGHMAEVANDGEAGLALALDDSFDVLVVDRMLPKRDGLSLVSELRTRGKETPVLILSALGQVDDRVTGLRAGGDDYLANWPVSKCLRAAARRTARTRFTASAISNSTGSRIGSPAGAMKFRCNRVNFVCSNT
jgi:DNA-binding response OmpR family regulator